MHVAIVGGGIAGLAAAHALHEARPDIRITVFEGADHVGGKIRAGEIAGNPIDLGAEAILARRSEGTDLIKAVGLEGELVHPESVSAGIWTRGAIRTLPPTVLGIPADLDALEESGILNLKPYSEPLSVPNYDVSVAAFVSRRVGSEVVDRLVEPLLGGVYAGHAAELSLRAAAPQIAALGDDLLSGAARARRDVNESGPVFAGLDGGIATLPQAVADASGATIRTNATVRALERSADGDTWQLSIGPTIAVEHVQADVVIVATPGPAASRLLAEVAPRAAFGLAGIEYASMAIVTMALSTDSFPAPPHGSGFLVPPVDRKTIKAATFSSNKWQWVARDAGSDKVIVRMSIGRAGETILLHRDDTELISLALADLGEATGVTGQPIDAHVTRWGGALPQYNVGHLDRVGVVEADIGRVRGLEVCGAAYHGVGIPAVIASARGAVENLLGTLGTMES